MSIGRHGFTIVVAAALGVAACAAGGPEIRVDRDPATDLSAYKTFAFVDTGQPGRGYSTLVASHLRSAALAEMKKRNYVYDARDPDLLVSMLLVVTNRTDVRSAPSGPVPARRWTRSDVETIHYQQGTLVIDLVDTRRKAVVWQGIADGRVDSAALQKPGAAIDRAMGEIFARL